MLVVFAFLGSLRSVIIPIVAIPLSLIGAFIMMLALGFSINLLSLLAMVLAIGLVVDDAIIVVENVHRHINEGAKPFDAALQAARELAGPIIAMTVVLLAVYAPIAFQGGLTGALFIEFAFTLVGTIIISTIVALTLSPMMCAKLLKPHEDQGTGIQARIVRFIDRRFDGLHRFYSRRLHGVLNYRPVVYAFCVITVHRHGGTVHDEAVRAGAAGGPWIHFRVRHRLADRDHAAIRAVLQGRLRRPEGQPQHRLHFPGRLDRRG